MSFREEKRSKIKIMLNFHQCASDEKDENESKIDIGMELK